MFKNIARTLQHIMASRLAVQPRQLTHHVPVNAQGKELTDRELNFYGRGKGGKHSSKKGNAAQLKRASKKANNIRKFNK